MANLTFICGTMGAAKTADALVKRFQYEETGQKVLMFKPRIASRDGKGVIRTRLGLEAPALELEEWIENHSETERMVYCSNFQCLICDEAQFLSKESVDILSNIVDEIGIPVYCYGLKTDYNGELFEGSKRLLEISDVVRELETVCSCGKKAIINVKISGDDINGKYVAMCRKCAKRI